ncbi:PepSY domain-containing protein [Jiella sp. M17.18]
MSKMLTAAVVLVALAPALAHAETERNSCTNVPKSQWMKENVLKKKVEAAGYKDIRSMSLRGSCYEVYAFTDKGERAEIYVDPASAKIYPTGEAD